MNISGSGQDSGLKKPYRKPTVDSRKLKPGVYGDYSLDQKIGGSNSNGPGSDQGRPSISGRGDSVHRF